jgi:hypothetical protein
MHAVRKRKGSKQILTPKLKLRVSKKHKIKNPRGTRASEEKEERAQIPTPH